MYFTTADLKLLFQVTRLIGKKLVWRQPKNWWPTACLASQRIFPNPRPYPDLSPGNDIKKPAELVLWLCHQPLCHTVSVSFSSLKRDVRSSRVEGPRSWLAVSEQHIGTQVLSSATPGLDGDNSYGRSGPNHGMLISREGLNWVHLSTALAHLQYGWNCRQKLWQAILSCHCCVATWAGRIWHCHHQ